jgi:hypothetical protein
MTITAGICYSFKGELPSGIHSFVTTTGSIFKVALYTSAATIGPTTAFYTTSGEATGTAYVPGGFAWTQAQNISPVVSVGGVSYWGWSTNPTWTASSITARGALIYNHTQADRAVLVLDFGSNKTTVAGPFVIHLPTTDATNAILRLT